MKFSEQWLREWVNPAVSTEQLAHQLTMAGLEVDAIEPVAAVFDGVVIGQILAAEKHPDADKLQVCQVDVGQGEPLSIVCGAANARAGIKIPAALVGAELPGGLKIKKAKLRGVESSGMLCSAKELGLAEASAGLLELAQDAPVGGSIRSYLQLDDVSIELGLTPNRGDCLSLAGIAREVAVLNRSAMAGPGIADVMAVSDARFPVTVEASADCPRYVGRVVRNINVQAETPLWMQERLRRSGVRSLGPVVDVTNYVMLELGQPMHAFDLERLSGGIHVRRARAGESLTLLNGVVLELDDEALVIADEQRALALAGIMGGEDSGVSDATTSVFLESAFFSPAALAGRARRYGLHTDSSHRFERGVSPELQRLAVERATGLLIDIAGGEPGPVIEVSDESALPRREFIRLRSARIGRLLGDEIPGREVADILTRLGLEVVADAEGWQAKAPAWRFDLGIEEDLIEEIARIHGYSQLPSKHPLGALTGVPVSESRVPLSELQRALVERGYQEAITYSFVDPRLQTLLDPEQQPIALANPISSEMAVMRTSLWPGLMQVLLHNLNRQQGRVRLFETGLSFVRNGDATVQERQLGGLLHGTALPEQWAARSAQVDFYDAKGDVEALLALTGMPGAWSFEAASHPVLHPGQSARILRDGQPVGWLGALHPVLEKELDLPAAVFLFQVQLSALQQACIPGYSELSRFPAIRRDLALLLDREVPAERVVACVRGSAPEFLQNVQIFDVYTGEGIDLGRKSVALGLTLQSPSRTLTDSEVDAAIAVVRAALEAELGATLRE